MSMDFDTAYQVTKTAAALFELVNAEGARSEKEYARSWRSAVEDIVARYPDFDTDLIAFAAGLALGRYQARQQCGCAAGMKPNKGRS